MSALLSQPSPATRRMAIYRVFISARNVRSRTTRGLTTMTHLTQMARPFVVTKPAFERERQFEAMRFK